MFYNIAVPFIVDNHIYNVYLLEDDLNPIPLTEVSLHMHTCAEIHFIISGSAVFSVGTQQHKLSAGQALLIPAKQHHSSVALQPNTTEYTFTANATTAQCQKTQYSKELALEIRHCLDVCQEQASPAPLIPWLYRILFDLISSRDADAYTGIDYAHMLQEYLHRSFCESPTLQDLANYSGISERQIQRILKKETGRTFTQELLSIRMNAANYLLQNSDMSNEEIASYVGYQTYAGFWKARKQFMEMQEEPGK